MSRVGVFALLAALAWMLLPLLLLRAPFWDWPVPSWPLLSGTIIGFVSAFGIGGLLGLFLIELLDRSPASPVQPPEDAPARLWPLLLLAIGMNLLTLVSRAGFNPLACGNILECSNAAYQGYIAGSLSGAGASFEYLRILLSPFIYAGIAMSVWALVFEEGRGHRRLAAIVILTEVAIAIATGTSRNLANIILFGLFIRLLKGRIEPLRAGPRGNRLGLLLLAATLIFVFFLYFSFLQLNRDGLVAAVGLLPFNDGYIESRSFQTGSDSFAMKGLESVVRYLCTGYFSFSLALGLSHAATFPLGSSMFLARRAELAGDPSYVTHSLPGQIESHYGWSYMEQWHSLFAWLLSDYPVAGVAAIMALLGLLYMLSLHVALARPGAMAKLPFFVFFIVVLYVPANNQVFQSPETAVAFFAAFLIILYQLARGRALATPAPGHA